MGMGMHRQDTRRRRERTTDSREESPGEARRAGEAKANAALAQSLRRTIRWPQRAQRGLSLGHECCVARTLAPSSPASLWHRLCGQSRLVCGATLLRGCSSVHPVRCACASHAVCFRSRPSFVSSLPRCPRPSSHCSPLPASADQSGAARLRPSPPCLPFSLSPRGESVIGPHRRTMHRATQMGSRCLERDGHCGVAGDTISRSDAHRQRTQREAADAAKHEPATVRHGRDDGPLRMAAPTDEHGAARGAAQRPSGEPNATTS